MAEMSGKARATWRTVGTAWRRNALQITDEPDSRTWKKQYKTALYVHGTAIA